MAGNSKATILTTLFLLTACDPAPKTDPRAYHENLGSPENYAVCHKKGYTGGYMGNQLFCLVPLKEMKNVPTSPDPVWVDDEACGRCSK